MGVRRSGVVLAAVVALGCTACSPFDLLAPTMLASRGATATAHGTATAIPPLSLPKAVNRILVTQRYGGGNQSIGTFTVTGTLFYATWCSGHHSLRVDLGEGSKSLNSPCNGSVTETEIPRGPDQRYSYRVHISVRVAPSTAWSLAVGEHVKK